MSKFLLYFCFNIMFHYSVQMTLEKQYGEIGLYEIIYKMACFMSLQLL